MPDCRHSAFLKCKGNIMQRKPKVNGQARILAQAFKDHGVTLAHRQALDVLARLEGYSSYQVMQQASVATQKPAAPVPAKKAPSSRSAHPGAKSSKDICEIVEYSFDITGFVASRKAFSAVEESDDSAALRLFDSLADKFSALGITSLNYVSLSEDDAQEDEDIKVFVTVHLIGSARADIRSPELSALLYKLATAVTKDKRGKTRVELDTDSGWHLLEAFTIR